MNATTVRIPPDMTQEIEKYRDIQGLEKTSIATRSLIKIGLDSVANRNKTSEKEGLKS